MGKYKEAYISWRRSTFMFMYERDKARSWAAVWKKAAKEYRSIYFMWLDIISMIGKDVREARAVARRLMKERDELKSLVKQQKEWTEAIDRLGEIPSILKQGYKKVLEASVEDYWDAIRQRDEARRWAAAWKRAAKFKLHDAKYLSSVLEIEIRDTNEARAVARRLLKERDEAERMLNDLALQLGDLANFIMDKIPGEPSQSEGATECAIRIMSTLKTERDEARAVAHYHENHLIEVRGELSVENAELRAMVKQQIEENRKLVEQNTMLRGVLEQVEWIYVEPLTCDICQEYHSYFCLWCKSARPHGHAADCLRQKVLDDTRSD